jgi:hypothetical protein
VLPAWAERLHRRVGMCSSPVEGKYWARRRADECVLTMLAHVILVSIPSLYSASSRCHEIRMEKVIGSMCESFTVSRVGLICLECVSAVMANEKCESNERLQAGYTLRSMVRFYRCVSDTQ